MNIFTTHKKLLLTLLGIVVVSGLVVGSYFLFFNTKHNPLSDVQIHASFGLVPIGEMYALNTTSKTFEKVTVPEKPNLQVIDMAVTPTATYYLLADTTALTTNLFKREGDTFTQLTTSPTMKFSLTLDPVFNTLTYLSGAVTGTELSDFTTTPWKVVTYIPGQGEKTLTFVGASPEIMKGGSRIVLRQGDELVSMSIDGKDRAPITHVTATAPFAVSKNGTTLVAYNPVTNAIDYFDIRFTRAGYMKSQPVDTPPVALAFVGDTLLMAHRNDAAPDTLLYTFLDTGTSFAVTNPIQGLSLQYLRISYE